MDIKKALIDGKARIGVWGCGYIGFTTMVNFAKEGIYSIGYDVNPAVIKTIQSGGLHIPNLDYWMGHHIEHLIKDMITVTDRAKDMMANDIMVHLIAIPTENGGEPWDGPIREVIKELAKRKVVDGKPIIIIIESTLTPGMFDNIIIKMLKDARLEIGRDVMVGVAPRRDWFDSPEKNVKSLKRVIGGTTKETTQAMKDVLDIICDNLILSDAHTVELVKSVENSIFHVCATYACQLARAYPNVNIREVLQLASTHWRIPLYFPSVGTGGYCIPVSSKYIRDGAERPEELNITKEVIRSDSNQPSYIADVMKDCNSVAILGISYKRDLKVHVLSPALGVIKGLLQYGINVKAYDPYYTPAEIKKITGVESFNYPDDLREFDGIVIVPPHRVFGQTPSSRLFANLREKQIVIDNEGIWSKWRDDFKNKRIVYHCVGDKGWTLSN
jgi:nucleotide sugar dehydrogenase